MNKRVPFLIFLLAFLFLSSEAFSQAVTISPATGGLAASPQLAGNTNIAIFGVQLNKATGGGNTVTGITIAMTSTPVNKFTNARLYESTDATFSGVGTETLITTGTVSATDISFTGTPLTSFDGATAAADDEFFFVVVDVDPSVISTTPATQPSLASTGVAITTGSASGTTITGTSYSFAAPQITIANLSSGLASSPLTPGATNQGVFGFSLTSTGTQTLNTLNIQVNSTPVGKWDSYALITSTDNDFSTTGDNSAPIGGLTFNATVTEIQINGLSQTITTSAKNYFLVVDVNAAAAGTITPSLAAANATASPGGFTGSATGTAYSFAPILTIANLSTGLAASPLIASSANQGVFGFSLTSNGTQTVTVINVQLTSTPASKWSNYKLVRSTDASYATAGDNSTIASLTFTPNSSQVAITGLSEAISATTNYFLVVDVDPAVSGATPAIQPSLAAGNVTITTGEGIATGSATGTNYSFGVATATFTQLTTGIAPSPLSAGTSNQAVLGFSASSNSSQSFTAIHIQLTSTPTSKWSSYSLVRSTDNSFTTSGDNTTISGLTFTPSATEIAITGLTETLTGTAKNYFLVVTVDPAATTATATIRPTFTETNISVAGNVNSITATGTNYSFNTSQLSDITFVSGSGTTLNYRNRQATSIDDTNLSGSFNLGLFQLRDGAGASDGDNKVTSITSITLQITKPANILQIALFNENNGQSSDNKEIAGTEQVMPGTGTVTFTPSTPIRTLTDGGNWNLMVRVTFKPTVTDNDPMVITVTGVTGETGYSGFAAADAGAASSSTGSNHTILVTASKFKFNPAVATTAAKTVNFGPVTIVAVDGNAPLSNIDTDYTGKIDLIATGGPGSLTGGGQKTFVAGQVTVSTLSISQAGTYSLEVSDDDYNDAPDNQSSMEDISASITITSSASIIVQSVDPVLCYGGSTATETLSAITITETDFAGITGSGTVTFSLALPSGFVFDQSVTSGVSVSGGSDLSSPSGYTYPGANVVEFSFNVNGTSNTNTITISGLKARYPHPGTNNPTASTGSLNITRLGGTANIAGGGAGVVLGIISATKQTADVDFTVAELAGNPDVDPGTTKFNAGSVPVKLVPSSPIAESVFQGSSGGVTYSSPDYRFNPSSLAAGTYPVTLIYTNSSGCQSYFTKNFEVIISGIAGLNATYCNNAGPSSDMTVNQAYIDQIMQYSSYPTTWVLDKFVYYDYTFGWRNITSPVNNKFAPALSEYQDDYAYWGNRIPVGFSVYNTNPAAAVPAGSNYVATYQWVTVNAAPSPSFTLAKTTFCLDDPAAVLNGTPANSDNTGKDFFFATDTIAPTYNPAPLGTISVTTPPTSKVWSFDPGVLGVGKAYIWYTYENPATGCTGTSAPIKVTVNSRPAKVNAAAITSPGGIAPETCQGAPIGTFSATPLTAPSQYTWYSNSALTTVVGTGNSFAPPNPPVDPNVSTPSGSPHTFYVTQTINGCESNKQPVSPELPLTLTVTIKASPSSPTPNFPDSPDREFCVGATIITSNLVVPGTNIQWYTPGTSTVVFSGSSPTLANLNIPNPTTGPAVYNYEVSQTVSLCESPRTPVKVTIKALPSLSVLPSTDPLKICTEGGHDGGSSTLITFSGSDENGPVSTGSWTVPSGSALAPGALIPGGGTALLNTPNLTPDNYTLRFTHTNAANCSNFVDIPLTVLPKIIPSLYPLDSCFESFVRLNNTSKIQTGAGTSVPATSADVVSTSWSFNDGNGLPAGNGPVGSANNERTKGTYFSPEHNFAVLGSKSISYTMTTTYCSFTGTEQITINPKPVIDFTWRNPCFDSATMQSATRFTAIEKTTPSPLSIIEYAWEYNINGNLSYMGSPGGSTPTVNYTGLGSDSVRLIVKTAAQCLDTIQKIIYVLPTYKAITSSSGYDQNFNAGSNFWIDGGIRSSWALGSTVAGTENSDGNAWATNLTGPNNDGEHSWVMSGCFNFSDATKPVVSMDIWSDTPFGVDGTVFQYNEDGMIESEASWKVLGEVGEGINWYDGSGISNSPGNQSANDYGWTGGYANWKKAIYKLDDVKPASQTAPDSLIVFRLAFGGGNRQQSGFAFDNVFIGERSRVVLLENFTNTSAAANTTNATSLHNSKYSNPLLSGDVNAGEIVKIQYHTPFPGDDPLNKENEPMNNSRTAFYGITTAPAARVDGGYENGSFISWFDGYNDDRVLTPALLKINATANKVGSDVKINVTITNTTGQSIPLDGVNLFTVIVEKEVLRTGNETLFGSTSNTEFAYVARQMLPSAAGISLSGSLGGGNDYTGLPEITWSHPNGGDAIVVFIQRIDDTNKTVYQAHIIESPPLPETVTATEDTEYTKNIYIYPNPANNLVNIELPAAADKSIPVSLTDAFGRIVYQAEFRAGEKVKTISISNIAEGIYILQLSAPQGSKVIKKVLVTHR